MTSWFDIRDHLVHTLTHVNEENQTGRTECGEYIGYMFRDLDDTATVTCFECITAPSISRPRDDLLRNGTWLKKLLP